MFAICTFLMWRRLLWWYHVMITTLLREHSLSFLQIRMNFAPLYFYTDDLLSLKPQFMNHEGRYLCRAAVNQELSTSWWWAGIMSLSLLSKYSRFGYTILRTHQWNLLWILLSHSHRGGGFLFDIAPIDWPS